MATKRKGKIAVTILLNEEVYTLLACWRGQHALGRVSRAYTIRCILANYLGAPGWNYGPAGYGAAWTRTPGWDLNDPRPQQAPQRAQFDQNGLPLDPTPTTPRLRLV
jgi:hypothetical protein